MAKTVYDVLSAAAKYDGSKTAHKDVIDCLNKHGHHAKMSDAWCTETIMAIMYDAGCIDLQWLKGHICLHIRLYEGIR